MEIKSETVYVIYRNGKPWPHVKKPVYLKKNHATGQITSIAKDEAETIVRTGPQLKTLEWYERRQEISELTDKIKSEFEVIEYGPKRTN